MSANRWMGLATKARPQKCWALLLDVWLSWSMTSLQVYECKTMIEKYGILASTTLMKWEVGVCKLWHCYSDVSIRCYIRSFRLRRVQSAAFSWNAISQGHWSLLLYHPCLQKMGPILQLIIATIYQRITIHTDMYTRTDIWYVYSPWN